MLSRETLLIVALCTTGCAGQASDHVSRDLWAMHDLVLAACRKPPVVPQAVCDRAVPAYDGIRQAVGVAEGEP